MAAINLGPFNTVTLAASTPQQLLVPGHGLYYLEIINRGTGNLFISNTNSVGSNATSFEVPAGASVPALPVRGPGGIWVDVDAAGSISVLVVPRQ